MWGQIAFYGGIGIVVATIVAAVRWLVKQFIDAPEAWEDDEGFHLGARPYKK